MGAKQFIILSSICLSLQTACAVTFQIADPVEFSKIIDTNSVFSTNVNNLNSLIEGPVWIPDGQYLVFSDVGGNKLKKLVLPNTLTDYLSPPAGAKYNGNILDPQERLISCECGSSGFKVVMTTNGVIAPLVTNYNNLKFISPNDVCVKSDGSIWFTDTGSDSGIALGTPGYQPGYYVYRFNETNGHATVQAVITNVIQRPNGICFSPDETKLYVADVGTSFNKGIIMVYDVTSSNTVAGGRTNCTVSSGYADGIRCDVDGRLWATSGAGVEIYSPAGSLIGKILMANRPANLCFGGPQYKTLFIVGNPRVYSFPVLVAGTPSLKKLQSNFNGSQFNLSWPAPSSGFALQQTLQLGSAAVWTNCNGPFTTNNGRISASMAASNSASYFRLRLN